MFSGLTRKSPMLSNVNETSSSDKVGDANSHPALSVSVMSFSRLGYDCRLFALSNVKLLVKQRRSSHLDLALREQGFGAW